jgi:hypothetical protein
LSIRASGVKLVTKKKGSISLPSSRDVKKKNAGTYCIIPLEPDGTHDRVRDFPDAHLLILADGEDDGLDIVVLAQLPNEEAREVVRVDELAQRSARAGNDKGRVVFWWLRTIRSYVGRQAFCLFVCFFDEKIGVLSGVMQRKRSFFFFLEHHNFRVREDRSTISTGAPRGV